MASKIGFSPYKGPDVVGASRSGLVLAYIQNAAIVSVNTVPTTTMQLGLVTTVVSNGMAGIELQGTAAAALNFTVEVLHNGVSVQTFDHHLEAGNFTLGIPFLLRNIPAESGNWSLRMRTSVSTVSLPLAGSSWWIESGAINNSLTSTDPSSFINEEVTVEPLEITDTVTHDEQTPTGASITEAVSHTPLTITDSVVGIVLSSTALTGVSADDGYFSPSVFNNAGVVALVGNSGVDLRTAFWRFPLPYDLQGMDVDQVFVDVTPDSNQVAPVQIRVELERAGAPAAITSQADYATRVMTTAHLDTAFAAVTGVTLTVDITAMVTEILALAVPVTALNVFFKDNGSASDTQLQLRTRDHGSTPPKLRLYIGGV